MCNDQPPSRHVPGMSELSTDDSVVKAVAHTATVTDAHLARMNLDQGFDHLLARIYAEPAAVRRPSRRRRVYVALAMVAALAVGAGFASPVQHGIGHALTGTFLGNGHTHNTENDNSEIVDPSAPDFPVVARKIAAEMRTEGLRFAPGYSADANINAQIGYMIPTTMKYVMQVTGVQGRFADQAMCTWDHTWVDAYATGDRHTMQVAVDGMRQLVKMKIYAQINVARWQAGLIKAIESGDASRMQTEVRLNCGPEIK